MDSALEQLRFCVECVLVVSGPFGRVLVPKLTRLRVNSNLLGIIIFCSDISFHREVIDEYREFSNLYKEDCDFLYIENDIDKVSNRVLKIVKERESKNY